MSSIFQSAESQFIAIVGAAFVVGAATAFYRWMKKNVAEPLKQVPEIQRLVESHIATDASDHEHVSEMVADLRREIEK